MRFPRIPFLRRNAVVDTEFTPAEEVTQEPETPRTLGTFGGVFTPSFLTIIGVIMYLRFSWIVAKAGLIQTLMIVGIANVITFITALSVASIGSNERMETGGAYFMISRVLGLQAGGSIGVPLYLSQALSISLYVIGFAESLHAIVPTLSVTSIALVTLVVLTMLSLVGAAFMVKVQYVILVVVLLSLVSIFAGFDVAFAHLEPDYGDGASFWSVFAIFFPAVTGILAGVSMSGDLKTPGRSITRGTLLAVGAGFLIYLAVPAMLAFSVPRGALPASTALRDAARWPLFVTIGVIGATLSSAIGTLLAAPRTLQALAKDRIVPRPFSAGVGSRNEPLPALALSVAMAFVAILLGDLNVVAGILTMFFLTTYGVLNFAAGIETAVGNPSFRPSIKIPWPINMVGALGCFAVMFLINPLFTAIALAIVATLFLFLTARNRDVRGGIWEGFWLSLLFRTSENLQNARTGTGTGKNWRPLVQVFASEPHAHSELLHTAAALTGSSGVLAIYQLVDRKRRDEPAPEIADLIEGKNVYFKRIVTDDFQEGVVVASQAEGFAAGSSNTVMMGLPSNAWNDRANVRMLTHLCDLEKNIILFHKGHREWRAFRGPIHVWWGGRENNVRLMLVLAHILSTSQTDQEFVIRLSSIVTSLEDRDSALEQLQQTSADLRITAETNVYVNEESGDPLSIIAAESKDAALILMGMARPGEGSDRGFLSRLRDTAEELESAMFVFNNLPDIRYE